MEHAAKFADEQKRADEHDKRKPAGQEVIQATEALLRSPGNERLSYRQALSQVLMSDADLRDRYNREQLKIELSAAEGGRTAMRQYKDKDWYDKMERDDAVKFLARKSVTRSKTRSVSNCSCEAATASGRRNPSRT